MVIDPGYFWVAYTAHDITNIIMIVIDPGYFWVAYTQRPAWAEHSGVIDPGYFCVAYTRDSKTSLCNKVLYCEVYNPYSLTRVRVIFVLEYKTEI